MTLDGFAGLLSLQTIIAALFAWLGKVWSARIARNEQAELNERIKKLEATLEPSSHITRAQYEREFDIYRELWEKMHSATGAAFAAPVIKDASLRPDADHRQKQNEILAKAIGELGATVHHNRPFYADSVYLAVQPIYQFASEAWTFHSIGMEAKEYTNWALSKSEIVLAQQDEVEKAIRNRMKEISVV